VNPVSSFAVAPVRKALPGMQARSVQRAKQELAVRARKVLLARLVLEVPPDPQG
jgi:hypothetical protein